MFQTIRSLTSRSSLAAAAFAALAGVGMAATPAQAQFEQGDFELRLSGFAQNDVNFNGVNFFVSGTIGYFISDQFEGGVRQSFNYTDIGVPGGFLSGQTGVFINYHFGGDGALQPFIGGSIAYQYGDGTNDTFLAGPEGGLKYFVSEDWFIFGEIQYLFYFDDAGDADESFDDGEFNYGVGLGVILPNGN